MKKKRRMEKGKGSSTGRRVLALLLAAALLIPAVGIGLPAQEAEAAQEKVSMDENAYRALGFDINHEVPGEGYFGNGNTVLNAQKELYFNLNGSSNYGYLIRDTMRFDSVYIASNDLHPAGAYRRYGQYKNSTWAKLNEKNGYNNGRLGATEYDHIGKELTSKNSHLSVAYVTSTEYKSASGKEDRVAELSVYASDSRRRCDYMVYLQLYRFDANTDKKGNVTYAPKRTYSICLGSPAALDEAGHAYNEQYDALFEVTAGDYDGDGLDEVAVYFGTNKVEIYKTKNDRLAHWQTITEDELQTKTGSMMHATDSEGNRGKERAAVVTLASGDLKKDFSEDLAIGVSMPEYAIRAEKNKVSNNNAYIYGYDKDTGKLKQDQKIELGNIETDETKTEKTMMATSVAIGDLTGNGRQELVVGGRVYEYKSIILGGAVNWVPTRYMAAIHVECDFSSRTYSVLNPQIFNKANDHFSSTYLDNYQYGEGGYPTPIGLAICNFGKVGSSDSIRLFIHSHLYSYDGGLFTRTDRGMEITTAQKNNDNKDCDKDEIWISHIKVGNFTGNKAGAQQLVAIVGVREKGTDKYWYYLSYIAKTRDGKGWKSGWEGIINQATSYLNRSDTARASAWVSLSTPDLDDDATVLEYLGAESYYTKPEVQAVMQSAPYFQDVADVYDNYLNNGATAYGTGKGSGNAVTASIEASAGVYASGEVSLGVEAEVESSLSATTSFEHQTAWETSTSVEYAGSSGDDYVVMYTIPYHRYWYAATDKTGKRETMIIEEPMTPATVIVPVDTYDAMAETYKGLEPIRGNLINSTAGEPSTYKNTFGGDSYTSVGAAMLLTNAGGNSGSTTTVSHESSVSNEESFSVGMEAEFKAGVGAGFLGTGATAGTVMSTAVSAGYVHSSMNGVTYTATVDNLPAGVTGYGFNWQFGIQKRQLNGESVVLLGYQLSNVKEAPKPPKQLAITEITSREMTLEWKGTPDVAYYELLLITNNGMELPQGTIPSTQADGDGRVTYTVSSLLPNTQYSYQVIAVDGSGVKSIPSMTVTGTTLSEGDTGFRITQQPEDEQVYAGGTAIFEVVTENGTGKSLNYRWQNYDSKSGSWKYMNTGYNRRLSFTASPDLDGTMYRCVVYTGGTVLTSNVARLTIGRSPSTTELTVKNASQEILADRAVVQASGAVTEEVSVGTMEVSYSVTAEIDGVTYTKVTDGSGHILWVTEDAEGNSHYYGNQALEGGDSPLIGEGAELSQESDYTFVTYKPLGEEDENLEVDKRYETGDRMEIPADTAAPAPADVTIESWDGCYHTGSEYIFAGTVLEGADETTGYYLADGTEVFFEDNWQYVTVGDAKVSLRELEDVTETRTEDVMEQQTKVVEGDKLTLTAAVRDGENYVTDSAPSFQILNTTTGVSISVAASKSGDEYTAQYVFTEPGVYEVAAVYGGSVRYQFSRSDSITLIVKGADAWMSISGGSMTYGDTLDLNPVVLDEHGEQAADGDIRYTVKKENTTLTEEQAGISGNLFTPASVGTYQITATDTEKDITAASTVTVNKRTITFTPADLEASVSDSPSAKTEKLNATKVLTNSESDGKVKVQGLASGDILASYELLCGALTSSAASEYPITVADVRFSSGDRNNYTIVLNRGTYKLTQDRVQVTAQAGANGELQIYYEALGGGQPVEIKSGTYIPKGSKLTVSAQPSTGFGVEKWTVNGERLSHTNTEFTIDAVNEDTDINVSFSYRYSVLRYSGVGPGSISGKYAGTGQSAFASGGRLNQTQSVILTAQPDENSAVDYWEVMRGTQGWETIKAADGISNHTGTTYTVSNVHEDTQVRVHFKTKTERTVTLQFKNRGDDRTETVFSAGTTLKVNGESVTAANKKYTFTSFDGDNLTLDITVPDNMLVDHWARIGSDGKETIVANNVKQLRVYDLDGDGQYIVYCSIPNQGRVTWGKELDNTHGNGGTLDAAGTITADAGTDPVLTMPQGADVIFTAVPNSGYRISKWTVNGSEAEQSQITELGNGSQSFTLSVDGDDSVQVSFEKKPTVTCRTGSNGSVIMTGEGGQLASGSYVEFGSTVDWTITADSGYSIDTVSLNNVDITEDCGLASGNSDIRYYTLEDISTSQVLAATFSKKPVVTYDEDMAEGTVTAKVGAESIASGNYIEFGSSVDWTIAPKHEYVVEAVKVIDHGTETDITEKLIQDAGNPDIRTYTSGNVNADTELVAIFRKLEKPYSVNYSVVDLDADGMGDNGLIRAEASRAGMELYREEKEAALAGTIQVYEDGEAVLTLIPESADYRVRECLVNGQKYGLQADGTIRFTAKQLEEAGGQVTVTVQFGVGAPVITFGEPTFEDETMGTLTVESAGAYIVSGAAVEGTLIFTATPPENYEVKAWTVNGNVVEGETGNVFVYENVAHIDSEVAVILQGIQLEVAAASEDENMGTVAELPECIRYRDKVTLKADPKTGYVFDGWYAGDEKVSADEEYNFVAEKPVAYVAVFYEKPVKQTYNITIENTEHGTVTVKAGGSDVTTVGEGTEVTFTALPDANWDFGRWTIDGQPADGAETFTWIAGKDFTEDITVGAAFTRAVYYEVSYGVEDGNGTVTGCTDSGNISSDTVVQIVGGSTLTFTAEPAEGSMVAGWTVNGETVAGNLSNKLVIENLSEKAEVKVAFEEYAGYRLPESTDAFRITDMTRTPDDTTPDTEIRAGGTVSFTLTPAEGTQFTGLEVYGVDCVKAPSGEPQTVPEGDRDSAVTVVKNENGSYAITVENVWKDILTECETAIVLDKAEVTVEGNETFVYNGEEQVPAEITVTLDGKVLTEDDYDVVYSNNRDAGTAKITVTGKGAYIGTASGSYNIQPRPLTVSADDMSKSCGYEDPKLTYRTEGLVSGDVAGVTVKRAAGENPGTYAITVEAEEHPNYEITCVGGTFTVKGTDPALISRLNAGLGSSWKGKKLIVRWGRLSIADGYDLFAAKCGQDNIPKLTATVNKGKHQVRLVKICGKKIKTTAEYKFVVRPYRMVDGRKVYIAGSYIIHRAGADSKRLTNAKKIEVKKKSYRLKPGKTAKIKAKIVKENEKKRLLIHETVAGKGVLYWSSNTKVATVTVNGKIKAVGKGTCTVYVMADDGVKVKLKVKVR